MSGYSAILIKIAIFNNEAANKTFKADFSNANGTTGYSIKATVNASINMFMEQVKENKTISNFVVGDIIKLWFTGDYIDASTDTFAYPISSNLFDVGKINVIDFIRKLMPSPIYEIYCYIDKLGDPKLKFRQVPFDFPHGKYTINPTQLTDYTLTRSCEEVYTAFLTYIEGTNLSPDFYMAKAAAQGTLKGYNFSQANLQKAGLYGFQLLTCSFVGYNDDSKSKMNSVKIEELNKSLKRWFSNLDEMYTGDFTFVNMTKEKPAIIGEWVNFANGLYYVVSEKHSWTYGDNPMLNYQVTRGGQYIGGVFTPIKRLSTVYKEFE